MKHCGEIILWVLLELMSCRSWLAKAVCGVAAFTRISAPSCSNISSLMDLATASPVKEPSSFLGTSYPIPFSTNSLAFRPWSATMGMRIGGCPKETQ